MMSVMDRVEIRGEISPETERLLTAEAKAFLTALHHNFNPTREQLLQKREERQAEINAGKFPEILVRQVAGRDPDWKVAEAPKDLQDRRVEITGPVERKMMINALNSGAKVFMADFEDSLSPTWKNIVDGQINCIDAVRKNLEFSNPDGKVYRLNDEIATLVVRPRGWHLTEKHFCVDGLPISASLFDFGLYIFHNAKELIARGSGPYFYLPKMESHQEARLWNDVFNFAQDWLEIRRGTIRATVLIETILAAFEMEEILFELKDHASGLNAGRWDYIFSLIKKLRNFPQFVLPDRSQVTMTVPFMRAYARVLVNTCHRRGAHAMGGMAAFIPNRKDQHVNDVAFAKVREDKQREVTDGFDGTWVAHPDLVPVAKEIFDSVLQEKPNQKNRPLEELAITSADLLNTKIEKGEITVAGLTNNIDVALRYIESWLRGFGAAAIHNLMEDAATAEIARAQIWQWIKTGARLSDGTAITHSVYSQLKESVMTTLESSSTNRFAEAGEILDELVLRNEFVDFLTIPAYNKLTA